MAEPASTKPSAVVLLCFDGSDDAGAAIARAGEVLAARAAVVLTVWEPVAFVGALRSGDDPQRAFVAAGLDELSLYEIIRDLALQGDLEVEGHASRSARGPSGDR